MRRFRAERVGIIGQLKLKPDTLIVDAYCGSGSTLVAAKQLGYKSIGIELEREHCESAACRLQQGALSFNEVESEPEMAVSL
jgi:DNA modification methylase